MAIDYVRARRVSDTQIRKWGSRCLLRRTGSDDRECYAMEVQLSSNERHALKNINDRVYLITPVDLTVGPDERLDSLVTFVQPAGTTEYEVLRMVSPVKPFAPGGYVVYWEIDVRRAT